MVSKEINSAYQGIKFETKPLSQKVPEDSRLEELKNWCRIFDKRNLAPPYPGGSFGNLSFRIEWGQPRLIITGSRVGLKSNLTNDCFVEVPWVDFENGKVGCHGVRDASSESMLHFAIYQQRPDVGAVFHGHSPEILAAASKLGVTQTKTEEEYGTMVLVKSVLDVLGDEKVLIMKNHGFLVLGQTLEEAGERSLDLLKRSQEIRCR